MTAHVKQRFGLALLVSGGMALLDPQAASAAPPDTADSLLAEGTKLQARAIYAEACPKLAKSQEMSPRLTTLMQLAECYAEAGQTMTAWVSYKDAAQQAATKHDTRTEKTARTHIAELAPLLAKISISVPAGSKIPGLQVERDGEVIRPVLFDLEVSIDPGRHTIKAWAPNHKEWTSVVDAKPSEVALVTIPQLPPGTGAMASLAPPPPPPPRAEQKPAETPRMELKPDPAPAQTPERKAERQPDAVASPESKPEDGKPAPKPAALPPWLTRKNVALGMGAAGVVGIGLGAVFGVLAKSDLDSSNGEHCYGDACDRTGRELRSSSRSKALISTISFGAGLALVGGGAALWFTAKPSEKKTGGIGPSNAWFLSLSPSFGPREAGLHAVGVW